MARLENLAKRLDREYPHAADSLREGKCFSIDRLDVPLHHGRLATTSMLERRKRGRG